MPNIGCTLQRVVPALLGGGNSTDFTHRSTAMPLAKPVPVPRITANTL